MHKEPVIPQKYMDSIKSILKGILPKGISVYVFGSRSRGTNREYSDLDLCLKSDNPIDVNIILKLYDKFDESNIPFRTDIVDYSKVSETFKGEISGQLIEIFKNE